MADSLVTAFAFFLMFAAPPLIAQDSEPLSLPDGEGKALVEAHCTSCHGIDTIIHSAGYGSAEQWQAVFASMIPHYFQDASVILNPKLRCSQVGLRSF